MYRCEAPITLAQSLAQAYDMRIVIIAKSMISRRDVRVDFALTNVESSVNVFTTS